MSPLLVFKLYIHRVYEDTVSHVVIFDRLCELLPL
jgi:hypothetical protein